MLGWLFDITFGVVLGLFVVGLLTLPLFLTMGDPEWLKVASGAVGAVGGIRFMRQARAKTGPAFFRR